jgi:GNAT superfamily N-acetyltransferase
MTLAPFGLSVIRRFTDRRGLAAMTTLLNLTGYTDVPPAKMATIVTHLGMGVKPAAKADPPGCEGLALARVGAGDLDRYLAIFRTLGERWMWFSRLVMPREALAAIMGDRNVEVFAVTRGGVDCGLLELDFRAAGACEIAFFGLYDSETGGGTGHWLMNRALERAWRPGVARVWVHTCTFDHPRAVAFYQRSGFVIERLQIEVDNDPRLNGKMRRGAAPHVPIIEA